MIMGSSSSNAWQQVRRAVSGNVSVNLPRPTDRLTLKRQHECTRNSPSARCSPAPDSCELREALLADGATDLTRGGGPYASHAVGLASGLPALARSGPSRGFPCQIRRGPGTSRLAAAREVFACRASRPALGPAAAGALAGAEAEAAVAAARAARRAALIPEPATDRRGRRRYVTTRKEGIHQLRHYYASVMLAGGVSIKELAEYLGHSDPGFTLRVYAHMLPCSHDRARAVINERFTRSIRS